MNRPPSERMALAYAEDAAAIASWAAANGFAEDAANMLAFARKVRPAVQFCGREARRKRVSA